METTVDELNELLNTNLIVVEGLRVHSKASEKYVDAKFVQEDDFTWIGSVPYFYRRTGLFIETPEELVDYLKEIYPYFSRNSIDEFILAEKQRWDEELSGKVTTKGFFNKLINLEWNSVQYDLPSNRNFARRIQDIKEFGYTIATDTKRKVRGSNENDTHLLLLPIPKGGVTGYEIMSDAFKARAISVLGAVNVYELSSANRHGLLPDHKFPEIRWDEETRAENPEEMSEAEIVSKFQLLDNQRNQQKREVCRKCFQTDKRGKIFGINYYYVGDEDWPADVPKIGNDAESGCIGCGWYDIEAWRETLNGFIDNNNI